MSIQASGKIHTLLTRFGRERGGGVAILFAGAAMTVVLVAAGALEMHRRNLAISELQNAADAAALAGKKAQVQAKVTSSLASSQTQGTAAADKMFKELVAKSRNFNDPVAADYAWSATGAFTVTTKPSYDMLFDKLLPSNFKQLNVRATVDFANALPTEVALVLDTTASMFNKDDRAQTRFTLMRNAAKSFTHQLFNAAQTTGDANLVRMAVVPWATSVNVLGGAPAAADYTGDAAVVSIADKGSQVAVAAPLSRITSVSGTTAAGFEPVGWRGCITGASESAGIDDAKPVNFNALLVPAAPIYNITSTEAPLMTQNVTSCTCTSTTTVPCSPPGTGTQGFQRQIEKAIPQVSNAAFLFDRSIDRQGTVEADQVQCTSCTSQACTTTPTQTPDCYHPTSVTKIPYCNYWGAYGTRNSFRNTAMACTNMWDGCFETGKGPKADQKVAACVADPNEPKAVSGAVTWCEAYYQGESKTWNQLKNGYPPEIAGPNLNCPSPMLGLSGNRKQVIEYLDRMSPVPGGTHTDVGLRWGLRTLASTNGWPAFFGVTKAPGSWGDSAQKVMVMITDGENEQALQFPGYWGCNQVDVNHPGCAGSPNTDALDNSMQSWCTAIRTKYNVALFAIAVNFKNPAAVAKLQTCAGSPANVFSVDAADLTKVLDGIAARVMSMRLTQ